MDVKVLLILFVLGTSWCCNARVVTTNLFPSKNGIASVLQIYHYHQHPRSAVEAAEGFDRNENVCSLCEEFASLALGYLADNKTQTEIISILHKSCSKVLPLKEQCTILVDYYAPLLFLEVSSVQPEDFCRKIDLCEQIVSISQHRSKSSCDFCHLVVTEALLKLKDPNTQLDIVEVLLKACDAVEGYAKKCKRLVFEYAPLILINAEQFLEKNDMCTVLHACSSATSVEKELSSETSMHPAS